MINGPKGRRFLTTGALRDLEAAADRDGFTRVLDDKFWEVVDPAGVHVFDGYWPIERGDWRTFWLAKLRGTMEPARVCIDARPKTVRGLWREIPQEEIDIAWTIQALRNDG